jgi:hypothetical protein
MTRHGPPVPTSRAAFGRGTCDKCTREHVVGTPRGYGCNVQTGGRLAWGSMRCACKQGGSTAEVGVFRASSALLARFLQYMHRVGSSSSVRAASRLRPLGVGGCVVNGHWQQHAGQSWRPRRRVGVLTAGACLQQALGHGSSCRGCSGLMRPVNPHLLYTSQCPVWLAVGTHIAYSGLKPSLRCHGCTARSR